MKTKRESNILYSNYFDGNEFEDAKDFLMEDTDEEPSDDAVWNEVYANDDLNWDDFCYELETFMKNESGRFLIFGSVGRWNGRCDGGKIVCKFDELYPAWQDCDYIEFSDRKGHLELRCSHHDGTNYWEIKELTLAGEKYADTHRWDYDEDVHSVLLSSNFFTRLPHFAKKVYGAEW